VLNVLLQPLLYFSVLAAGEKNQEMQYQNMLCTTALLAMVLSYVIPLYWVAFLVAVGQPWLGLCYWAAKVIS